MNDAVGVRRSACGRRLRAVRPTDAGWGQPTYRRRLRAVRPTGLRDASPDAALNAQ